MAFRRVHEDYLHTHPRARAWAALDDATNQDLRTTSGSLRPERGSLAGKTVVILGSGVAGLTAAYELLYHESGARVIVLEAEKRTGGRCLTLRSGDELTEDANSELWHSPPGETQQVHFDRPDGDSLPYLNAGPGRIPSGHKNLLTYLKRFKVPVEAYVMNSGANLVAQTDGPFEDRAIAYRRFQHDTRGWLAAMVHRFAEDLLRGEYPGMRPQEMDRRVAQLQSLMVRFGDLTPSTGYYEETAGQAGAENARSRAGYSVLPGVQAGKVADSLSFLDLLESQFWTKTSFYQPMDFLWQPTLFQPVGGMDQVKEAFDRHVRELGAEIRLDSPARLIDWDENDQQFMVTVGRPGTNDVEVLRADHCLSNIAMPFLERILSERLQGAGGRGFDGPFKNALDAVYTAQNEGGEPEKSGFVPRFLACTTKVGWQANRNLWQGMPLDHHHDDDLNAQVVGVQDSEVGVVPVFGGISWTDHEITQIWYPSDAYHDELGVLTGAYNFRENAHNAGLQSVDERLANARAGAALFGEPFAAGLDKGVAIAWQNMPYIKGGWAQWSIVDDQVKNFNVLTQGTAVDGNAHGAKFFVIGDQISSLPGWQEGAITSALNAVTRLANWNVSIPHLANLPDTRLIVEGV